MTITEVHFGRRLRKVRKAEFGTQQAMADFFFRAGFLDAPNQPTIARWENMKEFTYTNIKTALEHLKTRGVNPRYFFYAHITDWKQSPEDADVDESDVLRLRLESAKLRREIEELREQNKQLWARIEDLNKLLGP